MSNHNGNAVKNKSAHRNHDVTLSKSLSYVLRHVAPSLGLQPSPDGYVPVVHILSLNHPRFRDKQSGQQRYTIDDVIRVVETNEKQRFKLEFKHNTVINMHSKATDSGNENTSIKKKVLCVRANQGHSFKTGIQFDKLLSTLDEGELASAESIIHGTTWNAWKVIRREGLRRMRRNHIHFATGLPTDQSAPISGMRLTSEILIYINGKKCADDRIQFYRSSNGILLTAGIEQGLLPLKYFDKVIEASSGRVIWDGD